MAEQLLKLVEAVSSHNDLSHRLRSESVKLGLERFYSILKHGVEAIDDDNDDDDKKLGLQCWSQSQIHSVFSIAIAIASATRSLSGALFDSDFDP